MFHTDFSGMVFIPLHTKFHTSSSNDSLVITIKLATIVYMQPSCCRFKTGLTKVAYFMNTY